MQNATILFDLDGTFVDSAPDIYRGINYALEMCGLRTVAFEVIRPVVGIGARAMFTEAVRSQGRPVKDVELDELARVFFPFYEEHLADETRPFAGAVEAARALAEAGAKLAVCTNKLEANARKLLSALGVTEMFEAITGGDTFAVKKPHPAHVLGTIEMLGGRPARSVMIGDSMADADAARGAGAKFIAVSFGYGEPVEELRPDASIDGFGELTGAVRRVLAG
jgi:phosphoglycolate phosphatase